MAAQQKPHSPAGGCEAVAVLLCNNTPHSSFMAVPEMANVPCMCVHVTRRCYISCQEDRAPSCRRQIAPDLEGRLEPGKKEPVQTLILEQPLITDKYGLQLCSTPARRYLFHLSASPGRFLGVFLHSGIELVGAYFWLKHN